MSSFFLMMSFQQREVKKEKEKKRRGGFFYSSNVFISSVYICNGDSSINNTCTAQYTQPVISGHWTTLKNAQVANESSKPSPKILTCKGKATIINSTVYSTEIFLLCCCYFVNCALCIIYMTFQSANLGDVGGWLWIILCPEMMLNTYCGMSRLRCSVVFLLTFLLYTV